MPSDEPSTEERILDAAHTVFVRKGTSNTNLKEIAEEADVNQALLHYYFRDKKTLADTVFEQVASRFIPEIQSVFTADRPIEDKVETIAKKYVRMVREKPYLPLYVVGEINQNPDEMKARLRSLDLVPFEGLDRLDEQLKQEADAGRLRRMSAEQFVVNLLSLSIFPFIARPLIETMLDMDDAAFDAFIDERADALATFVMNGLRSR